MATFEVEFKDASANFIKEVVENVDGYKDSAEGKWIDFVKEINSPGVSQVRRFSASHVMGIKRVSD